MFSDQTRARFGVVGGSGARLNSDESVRETLPLVRMGSICFVSILFFPFFPFDCAIHVLYYSYLVVIDLLCTLIG